MIITIKNNFYNKNCYQEQMSYLDLFPVGFVLPWDSSIAPLGWIFRNGQTLIINQYLRLFKHAAKNNLILTPDLWTDKKQYSYFCYGEDNQTFIVPDSRGLYDVGYEETFHTGLGELQQDQIQGHSHLYVLPRGDRNYGNGGGNSLWGGFNWTFTTSNLVSDGTNGIPRVGARTQPRSLPRNYIIKY